MYIRRNLGRAPHAANTGEISIDNKFSFFFLGCGFFFFLFSRTYLGKLRETEKNLNISKLKFKSREERTICKFRSQGVCGGFYNQFLSVCVFFFSNRESPQIAGSFFLVFFFAYSCGNIMPFLMANFCTRTCTREKKKFIHI